MNTRKTTRMLLDKHVIKQKKEVKKTTLRGFRLRRPFRRRFGTDDECESEECGDTRRHPNLFDMLAKGGGGGGEVIDERVKIIGEDTLYFCDDITTESISRLCEYLKLMSIYLQKMAVDLPGYQPRIKLYLYTYGGDAFAGVSAYQFMRVCPVPVDVYVHGFIASAGTLLLMGGAKRYMDATSSLLIHQLRGGMWGKLDEMDQEMKNAHQLTKTLKTIYLRHTHMNAAQVDEMMSNELEINASECLKKGIVDVVIKLPKKGKA